MGDLLTFSGTASLSLSIRLGTWSNLSHAALLCGDQCVEMTKENDAREVPVGLHLNAPPGRRARVWLRRAVDREKGARLAEAARALLHLRYRPTWHLVLAGSPVARWLAGPEWLRDSCCHCSEFIARAMLVIGESLDRHPALTSPAWLSRHPFWSTDAERLS